MHILQDPLVIHTKLPDAEEGLEVYTEQLSYYDMKEVGKVVEMTPPPAGDAAETTAEGEENATSANATADTNTGTNASTPSVVGTPAIPPDSSLRQERSDMVAAHTQGQATIHAEQGDPAQMAALVPIVIHMRDTADDEQQAGESYVAYIQPQALDEFARHTEIMTSENNRRDIDIHKVAHEVYRQIKRRLETERERGRVNV